MSEYRQNENPYRVAELLEMAERRLEDALRGQDEDLTIWAQIAVDELKDRLRFAWADIEEEEGD